MADAPSPEPRDWVGDRGKFIAAWGLPVAVLIGSSLAPPSLKPVLWAAALTWMGAACLINASRCGRTHCRFTGPFFLAMAVAALLHGYEVVWLGANGWMWLGVMLAVGGGGLWYIPEHVLGKFAFGKGSGR